MAMLAYAAVPASAASNRVHTFGIPGVAGVSAWGNYDRSGSTVEINICVRDTGGVYGAAAAGVAFNANFSHRREVSAAVIGNGRSQCHGITTKLNNHLFVDALSGNRNGTVRTHGKIRQIY